MVYAEKKKYSTGNCASEYKITTLKVCGYVGKDNDDGYSLCRCTFPSIFVCLFVCLFIIPPEKK
jgi:hypothetical protein